MFLRKTNAVVSLLSTVFLLLHAIINAIWMLSKGSIAIPRVYIAWILAGLVVIHAFISMDIVFSGLMGDENCKPKKYPKMNASTIVQRISGVLLLVFSGLHIAGTVGYIQPPPIVHAIVPLVFFTLAMVHVVNSTSRAFITLGIGTAKFIKTVDIAIKVICAVTLLADIAGFCLYLV
jgi:hypothetical protein